MSMLKKQLERNGLEMVQDLQFNKPVYTIVFFTKNKKDASHRSASQIAYKLYYVGEKEKFSPSRQRRLMRKGVKRTHGTFLMDTDAIRFGTVYEKYPGLHVTAISRSASIISISYPAVLSGLAGSMWASGPLRDPNMVSEQKAEGHRELQPSSSSGFTAINRPKILEDVHSNQGRLPKNVEERQDSHRSIPIPKKKPRARVQKPLVLQPRHDDKFQVSKSIRRPTSVIRTPRRLGKENVPPYANTARGSGSVDRLDDDDDDLIHPSREITAKLKGPAAPATRVSPTVQKVLPQHEDAMTRRGKALVRSKVGVAKSTAVPTKADRVQPKVKILPWHVAEVTRRSKAAARTRAAGT